MYDIKLGDRITFKAVTRWGDNKETRVVNGFHAGQPTVRYGGWRDFVVRLDEISQVDAGTLTVNNPTKG